MRKLYKSFLDDNITNEYLHKKFDYTFDNTCNKEKFLLEYKKFLGVYSDFSYYKDRFITILNSNEIRLVEKDIEHIFKLYLYTDNMNLEKEKFILVDFLYSYYKTIDSHSYKENCAKYEDAKGDFKNVLNKFNLQKDFFTNFPDILYDFYKQIIDYAIEFNIFIDVEIINRIFNNLYSKKNYYNDLINIFINNKRSLYNIIIFDNQKDIHLNVYLEYIIDSLDSFGGYNYAKEMLFELDKYKCITEVELKIVVNKYIDVVNEICDKFKTKQHSFIQAIAKIDDLKKELNYIIRNIKALNKIEKDKIRECLIQILRLKRFLVSDDSYVKSEMHESVHEGKIENNEIEKCRQVLLENELAIYSASKMDFTKQIETALEFYSQYPIQSLVSVFNIDSKKQIYSKGIQSRKTKENDNFKKYFDEKGMLYTKENKDKLMNKLSKDYYEELLKYLSKTFLMQQQLIILMLGKDEFRKIINKLKKTINYDYNNDYAVVLNNILAIENGIIDIIKKKNIQPSDEGFTNINNLFDECREDKEKVNGLMYLNYILYEKSGLNLRNNIMHGALIDNDNNLEIELLVSFSGLIFVSWMLNE